MSHKKLLLAIIVLVVLGGLVGAVVSLNKYDKIKTAKQQAAQSAVDITKPAGSFPQALYFGKIAITKTYQIKQQNGTVQYSTEYDSSFTPDVVIAKTQQYAEANGFAIINNHTDSKISTLYATKYPDDNGRIGEIISVTVTPSVDKKGSHVLATYVGLK